MKTPQVLPEQIVQFAAPEILEKKPAGVASDRWTYGVILAYLLQEDCPFPLLNDAKAKKRICSGKPDIEKIKNVDAKNLIMGLLKVEADKRITDIIGHKFFNKVSTIPSYKPGEFKLKLGPETPPERVKNERLMFVKSCKELETNAFRFPSKKYLNLFK